MRGWWGFEADLDRKGGEAAVAEREVMVVGGDVVMCTV